MLSLQETTRNHLLVHHTWFMELLSCGAGGLFLLTKRVLGGILVMWNKRVVEKMDECVGENIRRLLQECGR